MSDATSSPASSADAPATPVPDDKDWTWTLERPCGECGFVAADVDVTALGATTRELLPRWRAALERPDARVRPEPTTWSVGEYGAHVRDVFRIFDGRVALMLDQDDPLFDNWDQDATALAERYDLQDPAVVVGELEAAGEAFAARWDAVPADAWQRTGRRSNGSRFTVDSIGRYYLHDVVHHLHDVDA